MPAPWQEPLLVWPAPQAPARPPVLGPPMHSPPPSRESPGRGWARSIAVPATPQAQGSGLQFTHAPTGHVPASLRAWEVAGPRWTRASLWAPRSALGWRVAGRQGEEVPQRARVAVGRARREEDVGSAALAWGPGGAARCPRVRRRAGGGVAGAEQLQRGRGWRTGVPGARGALEAAGLTERAAQPGALALEASEGRMSRVPLGTEVCCGRKRVQATRTKALALSPGKAVCPL